MKNKDYRPVDSYCNIYDLRFNREQEIMKDAILNPKKLIIFCDAPSGTGKTFVATAAAAHLVKTGKYQGIVYCVANYGETKQGFLPGNIDMKSEVYFTPFHQALMEIDINPTQAITKSSNQKNGAGFIECVTHTFLRGVNFKEKVIILDEAQNFTKEALKKTLTRCHDDCKVIVIGHHGQIDIDRIS